VTSRTDPAIGAMVESNGEATASRGFARGLRTFMTTNARPNSPRRTPPRNVHVAVDGLAMRTSFPSADSAA
jgi:hypothetical protein